MLANVGWLILITTMFWNADPATEPSPLQMPAGERPSLQEVATDAGTGELLMPTDEDGFSLGELEQLAEENNPKLREALAAIESARGTALQVGLYPNPEVVGGTNQLGGEQSQYVGTIRQEIVVKGKLGLQRSAALRAVEQAELALVSTRFEVLTEVRQRFYHALVAQERVSVLELLVDIARRSYDASVKLHEGGEGTRTDVLLLDVELQRAEVSLENGRVLLDAATNELAAALGLPELEIPSLDGSLETELADMEYELVRAGILDRNARIREAQVEVGRRQILLRREIVEPWPNPTIEGGYQNTVSDPNNQAIIMLSLPIPVWNRNQGAIRSARAEIGRAMEKLGTLENELSRQAAEALGRFQAATQLADRFAKQIKPKAEETLNLTQTAYQQGQFDFLRLLQAQRNVVEADLGYLDAQANRWDAAAQLAGLLQQEMFP